jgi:hypothetical protein
MKTCPSKCRICGNDLPYVGLKPSVCDNQLCIFRFVKKSWICLSISHEEFGLGVDLESELKKNPDIVDLMISMAYAACQSANSNFNPFNPVIIEATHLDLPVLSTLPQLK